MQTPYIIVKHYQNFIVNFRKKVIIFFDDNSSGARESAVMSAGTEPEKITIKQFCCRKWKKRNLTHFVGKLTRIISTTGSHAKNYQRNKKAKLCLEGNNVRFLESIKEKKTCESTFNK